eukprot:CAMPEP_0181061420 /NCGR_PEP_ID=MMETSP1070-20121207/22512_1 /TAXON_ID=265543 /ORGANISM="Minutocellus polymorphus, Strain NH13" /LENGTH=5087 /DNA_ID=CAMNT_0023141375 /DNA_START=277 /DNA_END=15540 /DNA_ORIENTATION=+
MLSSSPTFHEKGQWKRLSQCFRRAAKMGQNKMRELAAGSGRESSSRTSDSSIDRVSDFSTPSAWGSFRVAAERFEKQRVASESGLAFAFTEGALVDAIRTGKWVLLDEINLASGETLERLCGLLDDSRGSLTLTERGDTEALRRHPDFRLFAAMNPATDTGKKDLPASIRARFTEIYVDELVDPFELRTVAARYLSGALMGINTPLEHSDTVTDAVDVYLQCRVLSDQALVDGGGQKPRYTLRTLCRALTAGRNFILEQRLSPKRAILEGFELAFEGPLDPPSRTQLRKTLHAKLSKDLTKKELDHPGTRPGGRKSDDEDYVLMKPFWLKAGMVDCVDWADQSHKHGRSKFVLTPSARLHLRHLARAVAAGPWPVLLEGPTSAGKTTLVEYLAARCGHTCVRINNHEHTDVQEYTGCYATDPNGRLVFQEGILVQALRKGHWVILDELNLAPSEVLEALNRLLDDNRELYLPEINETVSPHPNFRLFATQNPSGVYGGRKPLSRAFRNRFVEIHVSDIPSNEMVSILELRCGCPPTHAKLLVKVMSALRQRRSQSCVFRGKDGLITPRDLLRWAERGGSSKSAIAMEGYMLLAERLRTDEEKDIVRSVIEEQLKVSIDCETLYYDAGSKASQQLRQIANSSKGMHEGLSLQSIAPTRSMLRLLTLVDRCVQQKEPVLLVGETGCGKTTVVQLLGILLERHLHVVNCHASTETSDLLGGLRPVRRREDILREMKELVHELVETWPNERVIQDLDIPSFLLYKNAKDKSLPADAPKMILELVEKLESLDTASTEQIISAPPSPVEDLPGSSRRNKKRRKLTSSDHVDVSSQIDVGEVAAKVRKLYQKYSSLFEWCDGPLVTSMRKGHLMLLDEMSLAEDAVLERLNSVLEPSRTLVLAEKGGDDSSVPGEGQQGYDVRAHDDFRIFATMNPGGDFGKRELSPALRSRFTEIWVPAVTDRVDVDLVLERTLSAAVETITRAGHPLVRQLDSIREKMLNYVDFFNDKICGDPMSPFADFSLSLRDILAWARFIVDVCSRQSADASNLWLPYAHGASLMHLDGLGLGTGVSHDDASSVRSRAKEFLLAQVPNDERLSCSAGFVDELAGTSDNSSYLDRGARSFGVHPFAIPLGPKPLPPNLNFNLGAPTTGANLRRVLRGMQISKPILLEGSPGVGKTSLISALAAASGHCLVRINLSEQTDISDLMGSDLPVQDDISPDNASGDGGGSGGSGSGSGHGSFKWCDGVLLQAIKRGDWVLLDELNLASQSVLEGLNSCLDHRANVFIPELGLTFDCPPTFRIFAAQNPLAQGGGRKGLPKSFLNRFTKVYVDALTPSDLRSIVATRFPDLSESLVDKMVTFNSTIQGDIVERGEYGQMGSPWEFNLRDIFRWCQLMVGPSESARSSRTVRASTEQAGAFADTIYVQRLRSPHDRDMLVQTFETCFGDKLEIHQYPTFEMASASVTIGNAVLRRDPHQAQGIGGLPLLGSEPDLPRALMRPAQAVAHCVNMNWPTLLVGPASSGKSSILKFLSESCNVHLEEIALTQSSDVNELVGCFEQVDATEYSKHLLKTLQTLFEVACQVLFHPGRQNDILREICSAQWQFNQALDDIRRRQDVDSFSLTDDKDIWPLVEELTGLFEDTAKSNTEFNQLCNIDVASARDHVKSMKSLSSNGGNGSGLFRWSDGVLVKAMQEGFWLHFQNVNYCPASVLDRLNPLMESGGELVLTECGASNSNGSNADAPACRVIKAHPNFRLFLSMDPLAAGEVSRAMRNRCVEISLITTSFNEAESSSDQTKADAAEGIDDETPPMRLTALQTVDLSDLLHRCGLRSYLGAAWMLRKHSDSCLSSHGYSILDVPTIQTLKEWAVIASGLLRRGMDSSSSLLLSQLLAYELHQEGLEAPPKSSDGPLASDFLTTTHSIRGLIASEPAKVQLASSAKLSKVLSAAAGSGGFPPILNMLLALGGGERADLSRRFKKYSFSSTNALSNITLNHLRDDQIAFGSTKNLSSIANPPNLKGESESFFLGYSMDLAVKDKVAASILDDAVSRFSLNNDEPSAHAASYVRLSRIDRLAQLVREKVMYDSIGTIDSESFVFGSCGVMEVSFCLHEASIDNSSVACPITAVLYPLFLAFDRYVANWEKVIVQLACGLDSSSKEIMGALLTARDRMWIFLSRSTYHPFPSAQSFLFGFSEPGFIVQWTWFKKALVNFSQICSNAFEVNNSVAGEPVFDSAIPPVARDEYKQSRRNFELLVGSIDQALFDNAGDIRLVSASLWKRGGHPLVPASSSDWNSIEELRRCAKSSSLLVEDRVGFVAQLSGAGDPIDLDMLVKTEHPFLFLEEAIESDILGALSMASWATTDETSGLRKDANQAGYDITETAQLLVDRIGKSKLDFVAKLKASTIDTKINTVENQLDIEEMEKLSSRLLLSASHYGDEDLGKVTDCLLSRFAKAQTTQIAEVWCTQEEARLIVMIVSITGTAIEGSSAEEDQPPSSAATMLHRLSPQIAHFISVALSMTAWPVSDLRPYQTLVWASEGSDLSPKQLHHLVKCILSVMMVTSSRHQWCNSFNNLGIISPNLMCPSSFWDSRDDEEQQSASNGDHGNAVADSSIFGPVRLYQHARNSAIFRIVGYPLDGVRRGPIPHITLENYAAREEQARTVLSGFVKLRSRSIGVINDDSVLDHICFLLTSTLDVLGNAIDSDTERDMLAGLLSFSSSTTSTDSALCTATTSIVNSCRNEPFRTLLQKVALPLIVTVRKLRCNRDVDGGPPRQEQFALAWLYLGLLRLHLLVPTSPLDPARKPAAKMSQLDLYLESLASQLTVRKLDSGLESGDFAPSSPEALSLLEKAEKASAKRANQAKKRVERPGDAPPFAHLFQETRHFAKTTANIDRVLSLSQLIQTDTEKGASLETNWQSNGSAFIARISSFFSAYEDVTLPLIAAVNMLQQGLRQLVYSQSKVEEDFSVEGRVVALSDRLLRYPMGDIFNPVVMGGDVDLVSKAMGNLRSTSTDELGARQKGSVKTQLSVLMASLARTAAAAVEFQHRYGARDALSNHVARETMSAIVTAWQRMDSNTESVSDQQPKDDKHIYGATESDEEKTERLFREQFPDHGKEFNTILEAVELACDGDDDFTEESPMGNSLQIGNITLTNEQISLLSGLHRDLYTSSKKRSGDCSRIVSSLLSYEAANRLGDIVDKAEKQQADGWSTGSHLMALATRRSTTGRGHISLLDADAGPPDFHNDPNPLEIVKANDCLKRLTVRIAQLLRAFPGNSILIATGRVVERIRRLDLDVTSVGKALYGLEIILRKANEWEQHASERVKMGPALKDVSRLVAQWRKLELQSWSSLLDIRDHQCRKKAQRHFMRLHILIHADNIQSEVGKEGNGVSVLSTPGWIWKGQKRGAIANLSPDGAIVADIDNTSLAELTKALDSFFLTAGLGDFSERLCLLESFAEEVMSDCAENGPSPPERLALGRVLKSVWKHYSQFLSIVDAAKQSLRGPIEKRLKDEVKLSKWDEQSYYSLAESTEKSHRKLMKYLREYDEVLEADVRTVLERDFVSGIRSSTDVPSNGAGVEPVTSMPSAQAMFPLSRTEQHRNAISPDITSRSFVSLRMAKKEWMSVHSELSQDFRFIPGMERYAKKMSSLFNGCTASERFHSAGKAGAMTADTLCTSVFERIESLRSDKTTRPMKQRALVDLFKALKENGYSSMKWSIPAQLKEMIHLLQLPFPPEKHLTRESDKTMYQSAEKYFYRSVLELSRLQSEVNMIGSQYMSQREMALMVGFSEHGMLMIAQTRSMLHNVVESLSSVDKLLGAFDQAGNLLPMSQTRLSNSTRRFDTAFLSSLENLKQVYLLLKSALLLVEREKSSSVRDLISTVDSFVIRLEQCYNWKCDRSQTFVTSEHLASINNASSELRYVKTQLGSLAKKCKKHEDVPVDLFDPCLEQIESALKAAASVVQSTSTATTMLNLDGTSADARAKALLSSVDSLVEKSLLGAQILCRKETVSSDDKNTDISGDGQSSDHEEGGDQSQNESIEPLWQSHSGMLKEWNDLHINGLNVLLESIKEKITALFCDGENNGSRRQCLGIASDSCSLVLKVIDASWNRLSEALSFYRNTAKFEYVLLRLFRTLVAKGYCSDEVEEGGDGGGEGDASNMTFEDDVEGTGMGEGDGKQDVTDQLESEEQLLGLKNDEEKGEQQTSEQKALDEEEANQGMEMEADFDGEMFDVPEEQEEDQNADSDDEEELDREMGDGEDPNENVVDEKMWDDEEDSLGDNNEPEKFEQDSQMAGESIADEMRTKEDEPDESEKQAGKDDDEKDDKESTEQPETKDADRKDDGADGTEDHNEEAINEDLEDNYEDKQQGIDVREDDNADDKDEDDAMDLGDDLNLEDGDDAEDEGSEDETGDAAAEIDENASSGGEEVADTLEGADAESVKDEDEEDQEESEALQSATHGGEVMDENKDEEERGDEDEPDQDQDETDPNLNDVPADTTPEQDAHGIAADQGMDATKNDAEEEEKDVAEDVNPECEEDEAAADQGGASADPTEDTKTEGGAGDDGVGEWDDGAEVDDNENESKKRDAPNPFRNPGDAEQFWHNKLNMIENDDGDGDQEDSAAPDPNTEMNDEAMNDAPPNPNDVFEYAPANQSGTAQVLGLATEEEAIEMDLDKKEGEEDEQEEAKNQEGTTLDEQKQDKPEGTNKKKRDRNQQSEESKKADGATGLEKPAVDDQEEDADGKTSTESDHHVSDDADASMSEDDDSRLRTAENKVVTDLAQLNVAGKDGDTNEQNQQGYCLELVDHITGSTADELAEARRRWQAIQAETNNLSRRLCEKLRLVMEPLVATKLRGDYRTGKRINMKRVIGYIASGYRKDKIWLRRTKPAKRDYRVLLAVDDSESMKKSGAGDMALAALSTLANGMSQLEIGELGVASFGEEMHLLHPFHKPFTSESGVHLMNNFRFDDKRTRTALCVEGAIDALDNSQTGASSSLQLVFLISDGRIERDSRSKLRQLVREMTEKNILLVMIIVEGKKGEEMKKKDSIVHMKEVSFENGKPKMKHFIEDYPFPYYMVLEDMTSLPEVLGDALKQWFEIMASQNLQGMR